MPLQLLAPRDRTAERYFFESLTVMLQISVHSLRQYCLDLNPSLKTTGALRTLSGPKPGAPEPPRVHVAMHFVAHFSISLPFAPFVSVLRLGAALASAEFRPWGISST